ncbi:MAG: copper-translocating P-type ATPase [Dehalococcoidia bacterium]|nr:MAG: copper-translocating P-type ATPase [Dehalococcoidia bacterium]
MPRERLTLQSLHCVACAEQLVARLRAMPGVRTVAAVLAEQRATVDFDPELTSRQAILAEAERCGCREAGDQQLLPLPVLAHHAQTLDVTLGTAHDRMQYSAQAVGALDPVDHAAVGHAATGHLPVGPARGHAAIGHGRHDMADSASAAAMEREMRNRFLVALVLTIPAVLYSPIGTALVRIPTFGLDPNWILFTFTTPVVFWAGWVFLGGAYWSLRSRTLNMSVLVATGVLAAYLASVLLTVVGGGETYYEAAAMLVTFVLFGHWMEMKARRGTTDALRALFALVPPEATVLRDGVEVRLPTDAIAVGDLVVLRPGDRAPVDGVVERGATSMDESLITGESMPVEKTVGDRIVGGSINRGGLVVVRATGVGSESTVGRIVALVQQAQASKAPGQRLADRAAGALVVVAVSAGAITLVAWVLAGAPLLTALTFAISAVVIACPDALGLATPTAIAVGIGVGARHQILIKDAATLERLADLKIVAFDKTGTLTEGRPRLVQIAALDGDSDGLLRLLASAERGSEHPVAEAIVAAAVERGLAIADPAAFQAIAGRGLLASVDGREVTAGTRAFLVERGIDPEPLDGLAAAPIAAGATLVWIALDGDPVGVAAVADSIKPTAKEAVAMLRSLGVEPVLISGDSRTAAESVASSVGISRVYAEVLPADKASVVKQLGATAPIAMVGDGINDAPALAQADVGIAIGAGADVAIETADVVLLRSDPLDVGRALLLSKATVRKEKENLVWATIYNLLAIPIAAGVLYPSLGIMLRPEWAALLMSFSSIIVAVNAVLLRRVDGVLRAAGATR